ncbi:MAG: flagellar hook-length control protein FliK, partial [Methylococcaceae bacterium]
PEQVQTPVTTAMPEQVQTPVTTAMPEQVQTPVTTAMPEQVQTPVTTTSQSEGTAAEQTQNVQTQTAEKISAEVAPQVLIINPETTTVQTQTAPILTVDKPSVDAAIEPQLANEALPSIANQLISDKQKISGTVTPTVTKSENKATEVSTPIVQVMTDAIVAPLVTAQATPIQVEPQKVAVETTSSDTTTTDKPTLTSAKTLLMDAVASRNSSGDTANNGGNNTPSNPILQNDGLLNSATDNKQNAVDLKSFASLLTAEKTDVIGASITSAADKSAPQGVSTAVNKLIQDTKVDVPAMTKPISHPEWNQDMGERIVWMTNRGISSAEIKMNPQNMGPITVRIDMNQDQATIAFTAQNSEVRTALEASIPKLREMLSSQQVTLAEVNVSQQSTSNSNDSGRSQQQTAQMMADASANGQGNRQANQEVDAQGNPVTSNNNAEGILVDEFANGQVIETNGTNGLLSIYA